MKQNTLARFVENALSGLLLLTAFLTPLFFLDKTTEFYNIPKLIILIVMTIILFALWIVSWIFKGRVTISRTPLDIPLLLLLGTIILSTVFSTARYSSLYGDFPNVQSSAVAWTTYILLYFVTASHLRTLSQMKNFLYALYASATIVAVISLFAFMHLFLPFSFTQAVNFTPTGSSFATIALLLLLLPLPLLSLITTNKYLPMPVSLTLSLLFSVTIVLIGSVPTYVALVLMYLLCAVVARRLPSPKTFVLFVVSFIVSALLLFLAYVPFPGNFVQQAEVTFPKEIQLPIATSWKVSASAFRDMPFIGTGPATYLYDFTIYKPLEFNSLKLWSFSFDSAYNEFLEVLATLGLLGFIALLFICLVILFTSWRSVFLVHTQEEHNNLFVPALGISSLLTIVLLAIHPITLVSMMISLFVFAAFMMSQKHIRHRVMEVAMGFKVSTSQHRQLDILPVIIFIIYLIVAIPLLYTTFTASAADFYHRQALLQANQNGTLTYQNLQKAESLNPVIDLYRVDMAQTNFALANAIATKATTSKGVTLSNQDKQNIQVLLSQAVNEGRASVTINPRSERNWTVLASVYRNISGVAPNALAFALNTYGQAVQLDPLNPTLRLNIGGIYYNVKNYAMATRFFTDAANLKPDYVLAYYNLSIAMRDNGDLPDAVQVAKQTVTLLQNDKNTPDYKTAVALLADLQKSQGSKQAVAGVQTGPTPTPTPSSALQNTNLSNVNVSNLKNPPPVTPLPSVKPNPSVTVPHSNVTPTSKIP